MDLIRLSEAGRDQHRARFWIPILDRSRARFRVAADLFWQIPGNRRDAIHGEAVGRRERWLHGWIGRKHAEWANEESDQKKRSVHTSRGCFHIRPVDRSKKHWKLSHAEKRAGADRDVVGPAQYLERDDALVGKPAGHFRLRRAVLHVLPA